MALRWLRRCVASLMGLEAMRRDMASPELVGVVCSVQWQYS